MMARSTAARRYRRQRNSPRRGAVSILMTLVLLVVIASAATSFLLATATQARQSRYERDAVQALYAAEAGAEVALSLGAAGQACDELSGRCGRASWSAQAVLKGKQARVTSVGRIEPADGATVARQVVVDARRTQGTWRVTRWQRVPVPMPQPPVGKTKPALNKGIGEE